MSYIGIIQRDYFVLNEGALTFKFSKKVLNSFCDETFRVKSFVARRNKMQFLKM